MDGELWFVDCDANHKTQPQNNRTPKAIVSKTAKTPEPTSAESEDSIVIDLKNPFLAGVLAWLVPGLGHYYQGRYFKSILFSLCIFATFFCGCYLASDREIGFARNVYYSWGSGDRTPRLFFIPQSGIGFAAITALVQSHRVNSGQKPYFNGAMAPPLTPNEPNPRLRGYPPTLDEIIARRGPYFEIGTVFTVVAGLMNLLVIFDAIDGPLLYKKEEEEESKKSEREA